MSDLRSRLIRLAAAKPELRADILPLLQEDADPASVDQNKPESYYGLPPRGVQAARRSDPNRVVLMVTTAITDSMVVNVTNGINKKYPYDGTPEGLAATMQEAASVALRFQSMDFLDGPELNVVQAPRVPASLAQTVLSRTTVIVGPVYVALQGLSSGLQWVILPRAPRMATTDRSMVAAMADGSVGSFLTVFSGLLTQQDMRESAREQKRPGGRVNIYRLGHYLKALDAVRASVKGLESSADPKDLEALKAAASKAFLPDFPPLKALIRAVDNTIATGKPPKYPTSRRA
ncbi:MAG: hypothetical protein EBT79_10715 [Actinobacteria bacterium]|nr:hypothetical protein [Actinomycetota bacterium]NBR67723.1 hypothetical protein [Actinomycetota bacterium]